MYALAKIIVISTTFALSKKHIQRLGHVYPQELVEVANESCQASKNDCFIDAIRCQMFASESLDLEIELDDKGPIQTLWIGILIS